MSKLSSASSTPSETPLEEFSELLAIVKPDTLPQIATRVRGGGHECEVEYPPHNGSYSLVFPLTFTDGTKWAARISQHAVPKGFTAADARTMRSEMELLQLIRAKTTIPVPEIYHFDTTFENELGAPYSLIQWLDGEFAWQMWHDPRGQTPLQVRRLHMLESIADAMAQLSFLSSTSISVPGFSCQDGHTAITESHPIRIRDDYEEWKLRTSGLDRSPVVFREYGPFNKTADYYHSILDQVPFYETGAWALGARKMLRLIADAIGMVESGKKSNFVLSHPDLDFQNMLFREDGTLCGLYDWDSIRMGPEQTGFAKYPRFLCADWNPDHYMYWSDDMQSRMDESSPSELRDLRNTYQYFIKKRLGAEATKAVNSHLFEAFESVCKWPTQYSVLFKICRVAFEKEPFEITFGGDDGNEVIFLEPGCAPGNNERGTESPEMESDQQSIFSEVDQDDEDDFYSVSDESEFSQDPCSPELKAAEDACKNSEADYVNTLNTDSTRLHVQDPRSSANTHPPMPLLQLLILLIMALGWLFSISITFGWALTKIAIYVAMHTVRKGKTPSTLFEHVESSLKNFAWTLSLPLDWLSNSYPYDKDKYLYPGKDNLEDGNLENASNANTDDFHSNDDDEEEEEEDDDKNNPVYGEPENPNTEPHWYFHALFRALHEDKLSEAQIEVLKQRFVDMFGATEVVEEEGLY